MKLGIFFQILLGIGLLSVASGASDDEDLGVDPGFQIEPLVPSDSDNLMTQNENILLVSWEPYPIDEWDFIVMNATGQHVLESGRTQITSFTKENFPDISLVFTCNKGDNAYFPNDLQVPIIGVDTLTLQDYYFQQYLSIIYTIHGFRNPTELWAHFILHQEAFEPVRQRISSAFQEYVENYHPEPSEDYEPYYEDEEELTRPYPEDRRRL